MGKALALASVTFIVLGTIYNGQRSASELETRRSVSGTQYETIARNAALAGMNAARQTLAECFLPKKFKGTADDARYQVVTSISGDIARIQSMGTIHGERDRDVNYTVVTYMQRWNKQVPFDIVDIETVPTVSYNVETKVIGSEITYGGLYDVPVTVRIEVGGNTYEPFGDYESGTSGVGADNTFSPNDAFDAGTPVTVSARSWVKDGAGGWKVHMEQNSQMGDDQLVVLRDGDDVPALAGLGGQVSVGDLLEPFTEGGKIKLAENQSIYLFELGTTNTGSTAYDLQDLVMLVDLSPANDSDPDWDDDDWSEDTDSSDEETVYVDEDPTACGAYELRLRHYNES